jgi:hypothetical protein
MTRPRIREDEPGNATLNRSNGFAKYSRNNHEVDPESVLDR